MKRKIYLLSITLLAFGSCSQPTNEDENNSNVEQTSNSSNDAMELGENEIQEYGLITQIEDGIYPMYIVTMELPERKITRDFNLNIEAISQNAEDIPQLVGNYATIHYTSIFESNLLDLQLNGKSVLGRQVALNDSSFKKVTGTLKGATALTPGDLPGNISVINKDGKIELFPCYITSEIVAINEQEVTAIYNERGVETITYIKAVKE